ncbi:MAG: hypothetical protein K2Y37_09580 [Pirellulales bacterium]|nr:hypothetical protein [Pirellulales bacterium]
MRDKTRQTLIDRRQWLGQAATAVGAGMLWPTSSRAYAAEGKPRIAALITEYRGYSHADVIVGRFVQGYTLGVEPHWPRTKVVSMYVDQFPPGDLSRGIAAQYGIRVEPSIEKALSSDGRTLDVDGVLLIGEHGNYPHNEKGQHMYPRRRFFEAVVRTFEKCNRAVPVFNDKHLGYAWEDAKWMYDQSRRLKFPLMAGSSLPTTWRKPDLDLPLDERLSETLAVGYGGIEAYGFHALETVQCMSERRAEGESGVNAVTCLEGSDVWKAADQGRWSRKLLDAAMACADSKPSASPEQGCAQPAACLLEHRDGFRSSMIYLDGYASAFLFAGRRKPEDEVVATQFWLQEPGFNHFSYLVHNIESMFLSGQEIYPVERTLLTTGVLDAVMTSRFEGHKRIETPWLSEIAYRAPKTPGRRAIFGDGVPRSN